MWTIVDSIMLLCISAMLAVVIYIFAEYWGWSDEVIRIRALIGALGIGILVVR